MGLVLSRRKGQSILIGANIRVKVAELHRSSVKLHIEAPYGFDIVREETVDEPECPYCVSGPCPEHQSLEAKVAEKVDAVLTGRPVVVPGVELEGMTAEERDRAMARWLFDTGEKTARHFIWRGDARELAEQIARALDVEELAALSGEMALAWRQRRLEKTLPRLALKEDRTIEQLKKDGDYPEEKT